MSEIAQNTEAEKPSLRVRLFNRAAMVTNGLTAAFLTYAAIDPHNAGAAGDSITSGVLAAGFAMHTYRFAKDSKVSDAFKAATSGTFATGFAAFSIASYAQGRPTWMIAAPCVLALVDTVLAVSHAMGKGPKV